MTVPVPRYVSRNKVLLRLWLWRWRARRLIHSYKRNPDCNERRRYRNDTSFVAGEHKHIEPLYQGGYRFERVSVPFKPFRFDGPTYSDGLALKPGSDVDVLSSWNWFNTVSLENSDD